MSSINQFIFEADPALLQDLEVLQKEMSTRMVRHYRPGSSIEENLLRILRCAESVYVNSGKIIIPPNYYRLPRGEYRAYYKSYVGLSERSREIVECIRDKIGKHQGFVEVPDADMGISRLNFPSTVQQLNDAIDGAGDVLSKDISRLLVQMQGVGIKFYSPGGSFSRRLFSLIDATGTVYLRAGKLVLPPLDQPVRSSHRTFYRKYLRLDQECREVIESLRFRIGDKQAVVELPLE